MNEKENETELSEKMNWLIEYSKLKMKLNKPKLKNVVIEILRDIFIFVFFILICAMIGFMMSGYPYRFLWIL